MPGRLHLRGRAIALHPPRRVRRLRRVRAGLPGRGDLLRGRRPEQWADYYKANVEFFDDLGSPGGAAKLGSSTRTTRSSRRCPRRSTTSVSCLTSGSPARLPLGLARAVQGASGRHPDGIVDLSVGTPVDPTPASSSRRCRGRRRPRLPDDRGHRRPPRGDLRVVRAASRRPRARPVRGPADDRLQGARRLAADPPRSRSGRRRRNPGVAYPTYDVGARLAGRRPSAQSLTEPRAADPLDDAEAVVAQQPRQPHGQGARRRPPAQGRGVGHAGTGVVVASDECYAELDWRDGAGRHDDPEHPPPRRV